MCCGVEKERCPARLGSQGKACWDAVDWAGAGTEVGVARTHQGQAAGAMGLPRDVLLAGPQCPSLHCPRRALWALLCPWLSRQLCIHASCPGKNTSPRAPCRRSLILRIGWVTDHATLELPDRAPTPWGLLLCPAHPERPHLASGSLPRARGRANGLQRDAQASTSTWVSRGRSLVFWAQEGSPRELTFLQRLEQ